MEQIPDEVDFPTPPFPDATITMSVTSFKGCFLGKDLAISSACL